MRRDDPAGAALVRQGLEHADALYNLARYLTRSSIDAEDMVQETYARAHAAAAQFAPGTNLKAWLFRILRNACIDLARRRRVVEEPFDENAMPVADPGPVAHVVLAYEIERAVLALPEPARAVILLDLEGFTESESAEILGCAVGTIKSRLARARTSLRERLNAHAS